MLPKNMIYETIFTCDGTLGDLKKVIERLELDGRVTDDSEVIVFGDDVMVSVED